MRPLLAGLMCSLAACLHANTAAEPAAITLEEIIARNTAAMGGAAAIENVRAMEVHLHISDPGQFEVDGVYRAARPGRMRIDIMADGKRVYMERFDGEKGWQWQQGKGEQEEGATPTAALRHGVELPGNLFGLHEVQQRGHRLVLSGREQIEDVDYYVLQMTFSDRDETKLYVDPSSWRITRRRDLRALHPDIDPTPTTIESRKSDWRQVSGVWFAFATEDVDVETGKVLERAKIKEIKVNPTLDTAIFAKP
ncbi:MAG TPA: hypothetical protein VF551_00870 [Chthoniobacterales bacterium]